MNILCISDLHGHLPTDLPDSDVLVIAGDLCPDFCYDRQENVQRQAAWITNLFADWVQLLKRPVIATLGNHDRVGEDWGTFDLRSIPNFTLLMDEAYTFNGVKFYGTPWSNQFGRWAFMKPDMLLDNVYRHIPEGTDIVISHGPPYRQCDYTDDNVYAGSRSLEFHLKRVTPKYVVCGHIHEARGESRLNGHTTVYNVSYLTSRRNGSLRQWDTNPKYRMITWQ